VVNNGSNIERKEKSISLNVLCVEKLRSTIVRVYVEIVMKEPNGGRNILSLLSHVSIVENSSLQRLAIIKSIVL
jgi:hypothetical protein